MNKQLSTSLIGLFAIITLALLSRVNSADADPNFNTPHLLAIYALSFDNPPEATNSLAALMDESVALLGAVTAANPNISVAILADGGRLDDTFVFTASNGDTSAYNGLPDASGTLDPALTEYDMTDGAALGGYILWARNQFAHTLSTFTYLGHGLPVTPYFDAPITDYTRYMLMEEAGDDARSSTLDPLPLRWCLNGAGTDHTIPNTDPDAFSMITPHAIGEALRIGTNDGAKPIDVFDSLHCFSQSIEQLYEVAGDDGHTNLYVRATVGSPSYAYFAPELLPKVLEDLTIDATTDYNDIATQMVSSYHTLHEPANTHPHLITAVDNAGLEAVKTNWATVGERLVANAQSDAATTYARVLNAYNSSAKYDTTVCEGEQEYELAAPDALVNFQQFALAILNEYDNDPVLDTVLIQAANDAYFGVTSAVIVEEGSDGIPHFGEGSTANWPLASQTASSFDGISLFTPLMTTVVSGTSYMPWQSLWYTQETKLTVGGQSIPNPQPLRFFDTPNDNWQTLLADYWVDAGIVPGVDVETLFCTSELPTFERSYADLRVTIEESADPAPLDDLVMYTIKVLNGGNLDASNVTLDVLLRPPLTFDSADPTANCQSGEPVCTLKFDLGLLAPDEMTVVMVTAKTPSSSNRDGRISADVSSDSIEGLQFNNSAVETTSFAVPTAVTYSAAQQSAHIPYLLMTGSIVLLFAVTLTIRAWFSKS